MHPKVQDREAKWQKDKDDHEAGAGEAWPRGRVHGAGAAATHSPASWWAGLMVILHGRRWGTYSVCHLVDTDQSPSSCTSKCSHEKVYMIAKDIGFAISLCKIYTSSTCATDLFSINHQPLHRGETILIVYEKWLQHTTYLQSLCV